MRLEPVAEMVPLLHMAAPIVTLANKVLFVFGGRSAKGCDAVGAGGGTARGSTCI